MREGAGHRLRLLLSERSYDDVDLANAVRLGALLILIGAGITMVLLAVDPPTDAIGDAGWTVAGGLLVATLIGVLFLLRNGERMTPNTILLANYALVAEICVAVWLTGGLESSYEELYLLALLYAACVHPPRRVLVFVGFVALAVFAPLVYADASRSSVGEAATDLVIWCGLAAAAMALMTRVRSQRRELREESEAARVQARVDPLTGLANRRAFDEAIVTEIARAGRTGGALSVLVADIDDFKAINDRHGHLEGDRCLREVAETLEGIVRRPDRCFRWGGDEFAVLMPETDASGAELFGSRFADAVERAVARPGGGAMRIGLGRAQLVPGMAPEELVAAADEAMLGLKADPRTAEPRAAGPGAG